MSLDHLTLHDTPLVSATEFKAKCLDLLDRVGSAEMQALRITKHGRVVAMLVPALDKTPDIAALHGCMADSIIIDPNLDLTAPVLDEPLSAGQGVLHG
jgi:antitoxin (DNA-binding transcriptional repressor) of toxin-antitoxin stability system